MDAVDAASQYFVKHNVRQIVEAFLLDCAIKKPTDVTAFMAKWAQRRRESGLSDSASALTAATADDAAVLSPQWIGVVVSPLSLQKDVCDALIDKTDGRGTGISNTSGFTPSPIIMSLLSDTSISAHATFVGSRYAGDCPMSLLACDPHTPIGQLLRILSLANFIIVVPHPDDEAINDYIGQAVKVAEGLGIRMVFAVDTVHTLGERQAPQPYPAKRRSMQRVIQSVVDDNGTGYVLNASTLPSAVDVLRWRLPPPPPHRPATPAELFEFVYQGKSVTNHLRVGYVITIFSRAFYTFNVCAIDDEGETKVVTLTVSTPCAIMAGPAVLIDDAGVCVITTGTLHPHGFHLVQEVVPKELTFSSDDSSTFSLDDER